MEAEEAYTRALEDLGSVEELLAYLDSLGPEGELPRKESSGRDFAGDLLRSVEEVVRETVNQTMDAVDQAAEIVRGVTDRIRERYPDGFKGKVYVHVDDDGEPGEPAREDAPGEDAGPSGDRGWSFSVGYNRNKGGFFCETGRSRRVEGTTLPSQDLKGIHVKINGDVNIRMDEDPASDVVLDGDLENLELRVSDEGVLSIQQGNTAASSFFFLRGLAAADLELTLPRRFWEFIQVSTVNGDIDVDCGLEAGALTLKTANGDVEINDAACRELIFKSASGDLDCGGIRCDSVQAETASGDIQLTGIFGAARVHTASGDAELTGEAEQLHCASASGDIDARLRSVPQQLDVSSKSGDCVVRMPDGQGFALQFSTVSGELETDFPLVGPVGSRCGEAIYLDGGGRSFRMSSISGDIALRIQQE